MAALRYMISLIGNHLTTSNNKLEISVAIKTTAAAILLPREEDQKRRNLESYSQTMVVVVTQH